MERMIPTSPDAIGVVQAPSTELRRSALSAAFITLLVVSAASPMSVVAGGFPLGIMLGDGAGTPALVLAALVLLLLFSAGYTAMATCVTSSGGFYALVGRGLGGAAGGAAAMVALVGYVLLQFGLYGMLGAVVSEALRAQFGLGVPWWACSLVALATVAVFGYRQIDVSARLLACLALAEFAVVVVLDALILSKGGAAGITTVSFAPHVVAHGNPAIGLLFCFAAFVGFEATTIYGEEAKDPKRSIPIATYAALLLIGCFYSFSLWCLVLGAGSDRVVATITALSDPTNFVYELSDRYGGQGLTIALRCVFVTSVYAGLVSFHNSTARYFFCMGREGLLPAGIGVTHPVYKSPHRASMLQNALCVIVVLAFAAAGADPVLTLFAWFSNLATVFVLVLMVATSCAVPAYFRREAHHRIGILRSVVLPGLSALGLTAVLVLAIANFHVLTGASRATSAELLVLLPIGALAGWLSARRLLRRAPERYARIGQDRG